MAAFKPETSNASQTLKWDSVQKLKSSPPPHTFLLRRQQLPGSSCGKTVLMGPLVYYCTQYKDSNGTSLVEIDAGDASAVQYAGIWGISRNVRYFRKKSKSSFSLLCEKRRKEEVRKSWKFNIAKYWWGRGDLRERGSRSRHPRALIILVN